MDMNDDIFRNFPTLETERLRLRPIERADASALFTIFRDEEVTRFYDLDAFESVEEAEELADFFAESFETERSIRWGIEEKASGRLIGSCGFVVLYEHRGEIGYELGRPWWGGGYMREALTALVDVGFDTMALNRIEAMVMRGNERSMRLLDALGFSNEGLLREYDFFKGAFHDMHCFALLRREWTSKR